jgi:hypothetical protein
MQNVRFLRIANGLNLFGPPDLKKTANYQVAGASRTCLKEEAGFKADLEQSTGIPNPHGERIGLGPNISHSRSMETWLVSLEEILWVAIRVTVERGVRGTATKGKAPGGFGDEVEERRER